VSFTPGVRNGQTYGPDAIAELVANYDRFREPQPDKGWAGWVPYASVDHEEHPDWAGLSVGDVVAAAAEDADGRPALTLDLDRVPVPVGALINGGQLRARSVEWFEPPNAFVGPDGPVAGKVLKCVSFLGSKSEAAKGMPAATAVFADGRRPAPAPPHNPSTPALKFESAAMTREQMIAALTAAGVPAELLTDAVPDKLLAAMAAVLPKPADPTPDPPPVQMSQGGASVSVPTMTGGAGGPGQPTSLTLKFADRQTADNFQSLYAGIGRELAELKAANKRLTQDGDRRTNSAKGQKVKAFLDEMQAGPQPKVVQAQRPALEAMLLGCDDAGVRKFADGKTDGTALDEQMALIRGWPAARVFGDKLKDPMPGGGGRPGGVREEVVAAALRATPEGRAALARQAAGK
jgi:hypothetical protein